jgi:hypothetical protein
VYWRDAIELAGTLVLKPELPPVRHPTTLTGCWTLSESKVATLQDIPEQAIYIRIFLLQQGEGEDLWRYPEIAYSNFGKELHRIEDLQLLDKLMNLP